MGHTGQPNPTRSEHHFQETVTHVPIPPIIRSQLRDLADVLNEGGHVCVIGPIASGASVLAGVIAAQAVDVVVCDASTIAWQYGKWGEWEPPASGPLVSVVHRQDVPILDSATVGHATGSQPAEGSRKDSEHVDVAIPSGRRIRGALPNEAATKRTIMDVTRFRPVDAVVNLRGTGQVGGEIHDITFQPAQNLGSA